MAPDLSNVTSSPRPTEAAVNHNSASSQVSPRVSRRTSSIMGPPPVPQNSSLPNSPQPPAVVDGAGFGAGPIRHPRPLTAAELHLELEKEQESIVNRLTRELSALRAQTASVASTTSSTSDLFTSYPPDSHLYPYQTGITPTSARRHRSSSNLSSRSARSARDGIANAASVTSVSGVAAPRERDRERDNAYSSQSHQASSRPSVDIPRPEISRQNSMSGVYRAGSNTTGTSATSPALAHSQLHGNRERDGHQQQSSRQSISSNYSTTGLAAVDGHGGRSPSTNTAAAAARYEEAASQRAELEAVKRENETLKMRIRELERNLAGQAASSTPSSGIGANAMTNGTTTLTSNGVATAD